MKKYLLVLLFLLTGAFSVSAQCTNYVMVLNLGQVQTCAAGANISAGEILTTNGSNQVVPITHGATNGAFGIAVQTAASGLTVAVAISGNANILVDGTCSVNQVIVTSPSIDGYGHCVSLSGVSQQWVATASTAATAASYVSGQISALSSGSGGIAGGSGTPGGSVLQGQYQLNATTFGGTSCYNLSTSTGPLNFDCDTHPKGPNPYVDITRYGAVPGSPTVAPWLPGITGTITSSSSSLSISSASTFQNKQGIGIVGAGPANTMSGPSAPVVTPAVAYAGTGTGYSTAGPAGSTQYCYQIFAQDFAGGYTAASAQTCTSTGASSLGAQTVNISAQSRSGTTVSVTTSTAHGFAPGCNPCGMAYITDAGWETVYQVADSTHFTYQTGLDTASGAPSGGFPSGQTVTWFNDNLVTWAQVTNAFLYWIVGRTSSSTAVIGVSRPQGATTSLYWEDFGSPMMDGLTIPYYIPSTAPSSSGNDPLVTTICSGAGTTTLTLCGTASNSVSGATVLADDGPNILAAENANGFLPIYFPSAGGYAVINFPLALPGGTSFLQAGNVYLNAPVSMQGNSNWTGAPGAVQGAPSFSASACPSVGMGNAIPGLFVEGGSDTFTCLTFSGQNNNALLVAADQVNPITFKQVNWQTTGSADYMGMHLLLRGIFVNSSFMNTLSDVNFTSGPSQTAGLTDTPLFFCDYCGTTRVERASISRRGMFMDFAQSGGTMTLDGYRMQGGITPVITAYNTSGGAGGDFDIKNFEQDTPSGASNCLFTAMGQANSYYVKISNSDGGICGNQIGLTAVGGLLLVNSSQRLGGEGQNITIGQINAGQIAVSGAGSQIQANGVSAVGYGLATPVAPTVIVGAHGSCSSNCVSAGTYYYAVAATDALFDSLPSQTTSATTDGTQTITVTMTPVTGQLGFNGIRGPSPTNLAALANPLGGGPAVSGSSYVDSSTFAYTFSLFDMGFGNSSSISSAGLYGQALTLVGGGFASTQSGTFTASRSVTWPDASGPVGLTIPFSFTTTSATSDNVTVTGMTASGHCALQATNATADTLLTGTYVSAKTTNQITVTHAATSGATFDGFCSPN